MTSKTLKVVLVALVGLAMASSASAGLVYDLRAVSATGNAVVGADGKTITNATIGSVVTLQLWATVTGGNAVSDEGFMQGGGSILASATGTLKGNMSAGTNLSPFTFTGSTPGVAADLNADGFMDLGSNSTTSATGYFWANCGSSSTAGSSFQLGTFTYTVAAGPDQSTNSLTFRPRVKTLAPTAIHKVRIDGTDNISYSGSDANISVGAPISLEMAQIGRAHV